MVGELSLLALVWEFPTGVAQRTTGLVNPFIRAVVSSAEGPHSESGAVVS